MSVDGAWRGTRRSADGTQQRWALAIGHAYPPDGPLTGVAVLAIVAVVLLVRRQTGRLAGRAEAAYPGPLE